MLTTLSLSLAVVVGDFIDRFARPGRLFAPSGFTVPFFRSIVLTWLWTVAMAVSQRPLFSALATAVTVSVLVVISNEKQKALREPLVFSDFTFIGAVLRHPRLFYLEPFAIAVIAALIAAAAIATAAWWRREASVLTFEGEIMMAGAAIGLPSLALMQWPGTVVARQALVVVPAPRRDAHLPSLGLMASLVTYWVAWLHQARAHTIHNIPSRLGDGSGYEAIVLIQAESFVDMRRHGVHGLALPAYDALKERALTSGLLEVPCFGAYTLRPEAAVLTGFGFAQAGFDAFHPYFRGERFAAAAIPNRLPNQWRAQFIHPFLRTFFRRDRIVAAFGFDSFVDGAAFDGSDREGPYVGDVAVARHMLAALATARRDGVKLFMHVVTMEAHDPYGPGRIVEASEPTQQYLHHLAHADRMLGLIAAELDREGERVLLVHYGDHAPLLSDCPDPFTDTRTDFLIVELGRRAEVSTQAHHLTRPEDLHRFILAQFKSERSAS